jgi:hypothetical protein
MAFYRPQLPFSTPLVLLKPTYTNSGGVNQKVIPPLENGELIFGSFRTFGGTERKFDGLYSILDTAEIETWYRPDITSDSIIATENGAMYEIMNEPENIYQRNQFLKFKVKRIKGGA